jgi:hypothetical protein
VSILFIFLFLMFKGHILRILIFQLFDDFLSLVLSKSSRKILDIRLLCVSHYGGIKRAICLCMFCWGQE